MNEKVYDTDAVIERLKAYGEMVRDYRFQLERLERIETKLVGVGAQAITDMPKSPSPSNDRVTDLLQQKFDLEAELGETCEEITEERRELDKAIKSLKVASQRAVIRRRYLDLSAFKDVNEFVFGGEIDFLDKEESYLRRIFNIHGAALVGLAEYFGLYKADTEDTAEA